MDTRQEIAELRARVERLEELVIGARDAAGIDGRAVLRPLFGGGE